ncbi:hypothetical protein EW146_g4786 [Bondarzewia mesenterica]|uniref:Protein HGH1 homolog n=1 Tax=Bondarzewia mesenterica TaxID=1095465 RepID=A0A4S4LTJ2_9AGAM|nr:hypothetical protein EW146_g4786 [Bondarzewia mesenterica]
MPLTARFFFSGLQIGGLQKAKDSDVIQDLKLLCRDNLSRQAVAHDAFRALVNLSDSPMLVTPLSDLSFLKFVVSYIAYPQATLADLAAMLLSNLTSSSSTCSALLSMKISIILDKSLPGAFYPTQSRSGSCAAPVPYPSGEEREVDAMPLLVEAFVCGANAGLSVEREKRSQKSELHFLASVFANMTTTPSGRMFFLTPRRSDVGALSASSEFPLSKLVVFTEHKDTIRRGGVISTLKNCSFYKQGQQAMLLSESDVVSIPPSIEKAPGIDALPYILLPLAGPEEFDLEEQELLPAVLQFLPPTKKREPDPALRLMLVETLLLLCTTRWGRDHLRSNGVYEVISEHVERLVNILKRDEGPETADDGQIEELTADVEDDEDGKIEEVEMSPDYDYSALNS